MKVKKLVLLWTCLATSFLLMFVNHAFSQGINSPSPTPTPTPSQATAPVPIIQSATETTTPTSSTDCGPRIRKSWSTFTADEKAIYLEAVNISMVRRDYLQFVEMHIESASESEAHAKGVFFFWHRMMLLGYENMLRSYGSRYACITVPYWDYVTESAQYMDNECFSIGSCSALAQDTGGTTTGSLKTINVLSQPVSNFKCVNKGILRSFCGHRTLSTSTYCGCVPRGAWHSTAYPSSANYASIYRQLFPQGSSTANVNIVDFTTKVLAGVHSKY
jgi:tyrosinase